MNLGAFIVKIHRRLLKIRLSPIRVFCFHQVSDVFESDTMWECDWTQTEVFEKKILALKEKYTFVPLTEAYRRIASDKLRLKNYATLTADDGWASLKKILPWLAEQKIPITLFLNPLYMDGEHFQYRVTEKFLTRKEVADLTARYEPYITIASHGWSHDDCAKMTMDAFEKSVRSSELYLKSMQGKVPFYAFTFGRHTTKQMELLTQQCLIPVLIDGVENYNDKSCVHRECIDGEIYAE